MLQRDEEEIERLILINDSHEKMKPYVSDVEFVNYYGMVSRRIVNLKRAIEEKAREHLKESKDIHGLSVK